MIKAKKGKVTLNGYTLDLLQEYSNITTSMIRMLEDEGMPKEDIKELMTNIVENEFLTGEEVKQKIVQALYKMFFGSNDGSEKYRVWCETNDIRDKVLVALENRGVKWGVDGKKPEELYDAPMGLIVDDGLWQTKGEQKERFDCLEFEELKAEDLIKEVEGNE